MAHQTTSLCKNTSWLTCNPRGVLAILATAAGDKEANVTPGGDGPPREPLPPLVSWLAMCGCC